MNPGGQRGLIVCFLALLLVSCNQPDQLFSTRKVVEEEQPEFASSSPTTREGESLPALPAFTIYYTVDPIPEQWINAWKESAGDEWPVLQLPLESDLSELPADGHLYVISPQWLPRLQSTLDLEEIHSAPWIDEINPTFTGFSFDRDNSFAAPWRWTPFGYVHHLPATEEGQTGELKEEFLIRDPIHLSARWRMDKQIPVNAFNQAAPVYDENKEQLNWQGLRQKLESYEFSQLWVPFAWWVNQSLDTNEACNWVVPKRGTLLHFDHLCVQADQEYSQQAAQLIDFLLEENQQNQLFPETGYFPVISQLSKEIPEAAMTVPAKGWLDLCEFALAPPGFREPILPEEPIEESLVEAMEESEEASAPQELAPIDSEETEILVPPLEVPLDQIPLDPPVSY